jgi:hypothetical protein
MCPHITIYVSAYYYICARTLLPHTTDAHSFSLNQLVAQLPAFFSFFSFYPFFFSSSSRRWLRCWRWRRSSRASLRCSCLPPPPLPRRSRQVCRWHSPSPGARGAPRCFTSALLLLYCCFTAAFLLQALEALLAGMSIG